MSINFQIGTYVLHDLRVMCPANFEKIGQRSRSYWHIMYKAKICLNSVPDDPINFIFGGWHEDDPPVIVAENGCHSSIGCLATEPLNLQFMIKYIKNSMEYKL